MIIFNLQVDYGALLGEGGEGIVYRARANLLHTVAVKFYRCGPSPLGKAEARAQILREIERRSRMQGTQHVQMLAHNVDWDPPFIVLEYAPSGTLASVLEALSRAGQVMHPIRALRIIRSALASISWVHHSGLVHRDIKPGNFLCFGDDQIKLTDFGVGRTLLRPGILQTQAFVGTFAYAAPEQIRGATVDGRADLYSAGIMLYEMLTGRLPDRVRGAPMPSAVRAGIPRAIDRFVASLTAFDPSQRPQSALAAVATADALLAAFNALPPLSPYERFMQRLRRGGGRAA